MYDDVLRVETLPTFLADPLILDLLIVIEVMPGWALAGDGGDFSFSLHGAKLQQVLFVIPFDE